MSRETGDAKNSIRMIIAMMAVFVIILLSVSLYFVIGTRKTVELGASDAEVGYAGVENYSPMQGVSVDAASMSHAVSTEEGAALFGDDDFYVNPKDKVEPWVPGTVPTQEQALDLLYDAAQECFEKMGAYRSDPVIVSDPWQSEADKGGFSCYINNRFGTTVLCGHADKRGNVSVWLYGSEYHKGFRGLMFADEYIDISDEELSALEDAIIADPQSDYVLQIESRRDDVFNLVDKDGLGYVYRISGEKASVEDDYNRYLITKGGAGSNVYGTRSNKKRTTSKQVYIGETTWRGKLYAVNGMFNLDDLADSSCLGRMAMTGTEIEDMLLYLEEMNDGGIDFSACAPELEEFYKDTHVDVAAMLAMIITAGNYSDKSNGKYWNFFDMPAPDGGSMIPGSELWDAKSDCSTIGEAMVASFQWIYRNYWLKGQDSYYRMSFNRYGYPQDAAEAEQAPTIEHGYNPWFDDKGYVSSGFDDYYAWCNKCARNRELLQSVCE
jgi:hypothetical protein